MNIIEHPLQYYVDRLANGQRFSQGMYGDGEWISVFGYSVGRANAEGTIYTQGLYRELKTIITDFHAADYLISVPEGLKRYGDFREKIDRITSREFVDKDVWDREVRLGGFCPLIRQLQGMRTCIVSNANLRRLNFLQYDEFIEISYPNCYDEIDYVVSMATTVIPHCEVYLVSAGLPAAIITASLHKLIPDAFCLDLGSVWDAFVGIGGQRGWRGELYADKAKYREWLAMYESVGVDPNAV